MQRVYGDILKEFSVPSAKRLLVFTANGVLRKDGRLVMGAGIAKAVRDNYPKVDEWFGRALLTRGNEDVYRFNFLHGIYNLQAIGALQTKLHYSDKSPLTLIEESLNLMLRKASSAGYEEVHLTMPGCGNGGLRLSDVLPLVEQLPDNYYVWSKRGQF